MGEDRNVGRSAVVLAQCRISSGRQGSFRRSGSPIWRSNRTGMSSALDLISELDKEQSTWKFISQFCVFWMNNLMIQVQKTRGILRVFCLDSPPIHLETSFLQAILSRTFIRCERRPGSRALHVGFSAVPVRRSFVLHDSVPSVGFLLKTRQGLLNAEFWIGQSGNFGFWNVFVITDYFSLLSSTLHFENLWESERVKGDKHSFPRSPCFSSHDSVAWTGLMRYLLFARSFPGE